MPKIGWRAAQTRKKHLEEHFEEEVPTGTPHRILDPYYQDQDYATG